MGLVALLFAPGWHGAAAQEPDSTPVLERPEQQPDRPPPVQDTVPQDTVEPPPPPQLPALGPLGGAGWARGVWEWDRADLRRLPDLSLLNLLERIPGVVPVRADLVNQAESAAVFGAGAGAIRYVVDGFTLDPLTSPTFDASRISLLALERVRVERRVTGATVWIETMAPEEARTKSVIEAGTGDYGVNLFRGLFLPPSVFGGPLGAGFERLSGDGFSSGSTNHTVSWLKWTWVQDSTGIQAEYRQSGIDRDGGPTTMKGSRSDWAVRARSAMGAITAEAYAGATAVRDELGGDSLVIEEGGPQGGLRLGAAIGGPVPVDTRLAVRFRGHPRAPAQEVELGARAAPFPWLTLEGEALQGWWTDRGPSGHWTARAQVGPVLGLRAFAEVNRGGTPVGDGPGVLYPGARGGGTVRLTRDGVRAGFHLQWGRLALGGAALTVSADTVLPFGLATESSWTGVPGGEARGLEAMATIPTFWEPLRIEGWYVGVDAPAAWYYTPRHHWRAGIVYHHLPLPSGNLELFVRAEHVFRGRMSVPGAPASGGAPAVEQVGAYRATNFELGIRVVSVQAFLRWENVMHRIGQQDLPPYRLPGQRILWGVKWEFWN